MPHLIPMEWAHAKQKMSPNINIKICTKFKTNIDS